MYNINNLNKRYVEHFSHQRYKVAPTYKLFEQLQKKKQKTVQLSTCSFIQNCNGGQTG